MNCQDIAQCNHEFSNPTLEDVDGDNDDDDMAFILHFVIKLAMIIINSHSNYEHFYYHYW